VAAFAVLLGAFIHLLLTTMVVVVVVVVVP
jgi:hypothetical protein